MILGQSGGSFSHRKVAPSTVQPGDTVVALDLLLALGAFALKVVNIC